MLEQPQSNIKWSALPGLTWWPSDTGVADGCSRLIEGPGGFLAERPPPGAPPHHHRHWGQPLITAVTWPGGTDRPTPTGHCFPDPWPFQKVSQHPFGSGEAPGAKRCTVARRPGFFWKPWIPLVSGLSRWKFIEIYDWNRKGRVIGLTLHWTYSHINLKLYLQLQCDIDFRNVIGLKSSSVSESNLSIF